MGIDSSHQHQGLRVPVVLIKTIMSKEQKDLHKLVADFKKNF